MTFSAVLVVNSPPKSVLCKYIYMTIQYGIILTMFGKLYRRLTSHNLQVTNGGRQRTQQAQQQDPCEPPQERQPKGNNKVAVQLEVCNVAPLCWNAE